MALESLKLKCTANATENAPKYAVSEEKLRLFKGKGSAHLLAPLQWEARPRQDPSPHPAPLLHSAYCSSQFLRHDEPLCSGLVLRDVDLRPHISQTHIINRTFCRYNCREAPSDDVRSISILETPRYLCIAVSN